MSWIDNIAQPFTIRTGDGKVYSVFSNRYSRTASWNNDVFSFIGIRGQLGKKEEALARKFPLEFYFQGADHLETSQLFENSLNDKNPCQIAHPLYGNIIAHIFTVTFSNSETELNITKITCEAVETITEAGLLEPNPYQAIVLAQKTLLETVPDEVPDAISISDAFTMKAGMPVDKANGLKIITIPDEAKLYTNVFNEAISLVNVITASPILAMAAACNFISMSGNFTTLVGDRMTFLESQFDRFLATVIGHAVNPVQKKIFELQASTCISAMCIAAITPFGGEYKRSKDVFNIAGRMAGKYNEFIDALDSLQVSAGGPNEYYLYSADIFFFLNNCVKTTISNLILIALNGKQERFVYTTENSNPILLAHKYYGGDIDDENLQYFCDTNNLKIEQNIFIPKGTKIVYYV